MKEETYVQNKNMRIGKKEAAKLKREKEMEGGNIKNIKRQELENTKMCLVGKNEKV